MKMISFNKKEEMVVCLFCNTNKVPLKKRTLRCADCKAKATDDSNTIVVSERKPAAVIETPNGDKVFVDVHGKEVTNHPYDLKNDPRGDKVAGLAPKERKIF